MSVYFRDDAVTVHHGDCLEILPNLPANSVDAVICDPPYNLSFMAKPWDAYEGREDAGFSYWLAGLIDGEGHFAIKQHTRGTHAPYFQLKMRDDERGTIQLIHRTLGIGTVTDEDREPNPMVKWTVQDKAGCQRLVDLLDKYQLRAKKRIDYWTWREAVCEWTSRPRGNRWHGSASNDRMATLRGQIMSNRAYTEIPWSGNEYQDWCRLWAAECLRVLKPGGHLLAFGGTRTWHRLACAVEDAGFEIRDSIAWLYGSGFPKSLDVSKAIDKAAGAEREVTGPKVTPDGKSYLDRRPRNADKDGWDRPWKNDDAARVAQMMKTEPATDAAQQWQGWGTALKPAFEPIVVARKPLAGTVAANVVEHGTGALNIDACRVETTDKLGGGANTGLTSDTRHEGFARPWMDDDDAREAAAGRSRENTARAEALGRWPANVVLDDDQAAELDQQSGNRPGGSFPGNTAKAPKFTGSTYNNGKVYDGKIDQPARSMGDSGGASRFFPTFRYTPKAPTAERPTADGVAHPTVKPLELMRWLVRLVTPPAGIVLDPFAGSGTTGEAAIHEHKHAILIERDPEYVRLIVARLSKPMAIGFDYG